MLATTRDAVRLIPIATSLPQSIAAILVLPYLYLNAEMDEQERALTLTRAGMMAAQGETDKVIRRH